MGKDNLSCLSCRSSDLVYPVKLFCISNILIALLWSLWLIPILHSRCV